MASNHSSHVSKGGFYNGEKSTTCMEMDWPEQVSMYDIYGINQHNFGFSETSDFKNFINLGRFDEGVMKAINLVLQNMVQ
jgi:hypothetical protein